MGFRGGGGSAGALGVPAGQVPHADGNGLLAYNNPLVIDPTAAPYNVKFDLYRNTGASIDIGVDATKLTVAGYTFTVLDIGKKVKVDGAGLAAANLKTTINAVSAGKAILGTAAQTTVSGARVIMGTDNAVALDALYRDLESTSRSLPIARTVVFPHGGALYSGTQVFPLKGTVKSNTDNWVNYDVQYGPNVAAERKGGTVLYQMWDQNVDCARVQSDDAGSLHQWNGKLSGFTVEQDIENTAGYGINFTDPEDNPVLIIDGGQIQGVAVMGSAQSGWNLAGGCVTGVFYGLYAFATGWADRVTFTANTTDQNDTLTGVSSFTGLAVGREVWGPGFPLGAMIKALNPGAGTVQLTSKVTGTVSGVSVEQYGKGGVLYQSRGSGQITFVGLSGDQNSGGLIRLIGAGGGANNVESIVLIGTKNEFGANVYRGGPQSAWSTTGTSPQGASAIVCDNAQGMKISVVGLHHHADASSATDGSTPNTQGRKLGPAILIAPTGTPPGIIEWSALSMAFANGSNPASIDQIALYNGNTGQSILHFVRGKGEYNSGSFSAEFADSGSSHRLHSFGSSGLFQGAGAGYGESVGWQIAGSTPVLSWYNGSAPTGKQAVGWYLANDGTFRLRGLKASTFAADVDYITVIREAPGGGITFVEAWRHVGDGNTTIDPVTDRIIGWGSITAARTATLPLGSTVVKGTTFKILDESGNANGTRTITLVPTSPDTLAGLTQVTSAYGQVVVRWSGTQWIGTAS
jgi:hypothetical protein